MELVVSGAGATWGDRRYACAVGRAGIRRRKREGDGATPEGEMRLAEVFYRPDRVRRPVTALPVSPLGPRFGWCDDPEHGDYNRRVVLPHPARCERLWRDDGLYDVVVATDHNRDPVVPGAGSAVFVHVAGNGYPPTEGCVALAESDLREVLSGWRPGDRVVAVAEPDAGP